MGGGRLRGVREEGKGEEKAEEQRRETLGGGGKGRSYEEVRKAANESGAPEGRSLSSRMLRGRGTLRPQAHLKEGTWAWNSL